MRIRSIKTYNPDSLNVSYCCAIMQKSILYQWQYKSGEAFMISLMCIPVFEKVGGFTLIIKAPCNRGALLNMLIYIQYDAVYLTLT